MELDTWRAFITPLPAFTVVIIVVEMHNLQFPSVGNLKQISCAVIVIDCTTAVAS